MMDYRAVVELVALDIAADPAAWAAAGFAVERGSVRLGGVEVRLREEGRGLHGWTLTAQPSGPLDGLPDPATGAPLAGQAPHHPNGVTTVDHVVAFSPELDRTVAALEAAGLDLRRRREGRTGGGSARQAFFRLGAPILEVVEHPAHARERGDPAGADGRCDQPGRHDRGS